jgi:hypothetical protein
MIMGSKKYGIKFAVLYGFVIKLHTPIVTLMCVNDQS